MADAKLPLMQVSRGFEAMGSDRKPPGTASEDRLELPAAGKDAGLADSRWFFGGRALLSEKKRFQRVATRFATNGRKTWLSRLTEVPTIAPSASSRNDAALASETPLPDENRGVGARQANAALIIQV